MHVQTLRGTKDSNERTDFHIGRNPVVGQLFRPGNVVVAIANEDTDFHRFMTRSMEWHLVRMAHNILKLHLKTKTSQLRSHPVVTKTA